MGKGRNAIKMSAAALMHWIGGNLDKLSEKCELQTRFTYRIQACMQSPVQLVPKLWPESYLR